jgi:hypothetical protein
MNIMKNRKRYNTEGAKTGKIGYTTRRKNETKAGYTTRRQYTLESTEGATTGKIGYTTRRKNETKAEYTTRRKNETKHNTTCVGHHYLQTSHGTQKVRTHNRTTRNSYNNCWCIWVLAKGK